MSSEDPPNSGDGMSQKTPSDSSSIAPSVAKGLSWLSNAQSVTRRTFLVGSSVSIVASTYIGTAGASLPAGVTQPQLEGDNQSQENGNNVEMEFSYRPPFYNGPLGSGLKDISDPENDAAGHWPDLEVEYNSYQRDHADAMRHYHDNYMGAISPPSYQNSSDGPDNNSFFICQQLNHTNGSGDIVDDPMKWSDEDVSQLDYLAFDIPKLEVDLEDSGLSTDGSLTFDTYMRVQDVNAQEYVIGEDGSPTNESNYVQIGAVKIDDPESNIDQERVPKWDEANAPGHDWQENITEFKYSKKPPGKGPNSSANGPHDFTPPGWDKDKDKDDNDELAISIPNDTPAPGADITLKVTRSDSGEPVPDATVQLEEQDQQAGETDDRGRLELTLPDADEVEIEVTKGDLEGELELEEGYEGDGKYEVGGADEGNGSPPPGTGPDSFTPPGQDEDGGADEGNGSPPPGTGPDRSTPPGQDEDEDEDEEENEYRDSNIHVFPPQTNSDLAGMVYLPMDKTHAGGEDSLLADDILNAFEVTNPFADANGNMEFSKYKSPLHSDTTVEFLFAITDTAQSFELFATFGFGLSIGVPLGAGRTFGVGAGDIMPPHWESDFYSNSAYEVWY